MDRKKIFTSSSQIEIMAIKNLLHENGIDFFELNKSDSSYVGIFDEIQLFVNSNDEAKATELIATNAQN